MKRTQIEGKSKIKEIKNRQNVDKDERKLKMTPKTNIKP